MTIQSPVINDQKHDILKNLLVLQYQACGAFKAEGILDSIAERILALGGEVPAICVAKRRLAVSKQFVETALDFIQFLDVGVVPVFFVRAIKSALADAYRIATCEAVLGCELTALENAQSKEAKMAIQVTMALSVEQYRQLLLAVVPLAFNHNKTCGLWLNEKGHEGIPLQALHKDIDKIGKLLPHLVQWQRVQLGKAIDTARLALDIGTRYPAGEGRYAIRTTNVYDAVASMMKVDELESLVRDAHTELLNEKQA